MQTCTYSIAHSFQTKHGTRSKSIIITGKDKVAEMDRHSFGTCITLQKERRAQSSTSSEKWIYFALSMRVTIPRRSTIGLKLVKMILKNPEGKTINFNHAFPDLHYIPSDWSLTLRSSQQGKLGKGGHYGSTRFDEWCRIQIQEPARRQFMGHQRPHEGSWIRILHHSSKLVDP